MPEEKPIATLRRLLETGAFHHATYRNQGTLWEGLHFYACAEDGFRGFRHAGIIGRDDPDLTAAEELVRGTGVSVSVGAYGEG